MAVSKERIGEIIEYSIENSEEKACEKFCISVESLQRYRRIYNAKISIVKTDKKEGSFDWREWVPNMQERQKLHEKYSTSQNDANIKIETSYPCIVLKPMADMHIGSLGTNYDRLLDFTDALLEIPYLYTCFIGDETDTFVSFKSQLPMLSQILSPEEQDEFLSSWLNEIDHKLLFATWGNHSSFEEKVSARNSVKKILSKNTVYFNGIGICNLELNAVKYQIVATHVTRYSSSFNKTHGLKQLARKEIPFADIYLTGHIHDPSYEVSFERGIDQLFMVLGSLKENDSFAKRYFSYFASKKDGAIVLDSTNKRVIAYPSLADALEYAKLRNGE